MDTRVADKSASAGRTGPSRRAFWTRQLHQWHWISSAVCLAALLLFAVTGFTLNHAGTIEARPQVDRRTVQLPAPLHEAVAGEDARTSAPLPGPVAGWLEDRLSARLGDRPAEWSPGEIYLSLPRPGGDAWLNIDRETGEVEYELTRRGWIAFANDLHKGRHTGPVWAVFIDVFALACLVFAITGLFLLKLHAPRRASTWPLVALGVLLPLLLILLH